MASLYIKDAETSRLVQELAERRQLTKTAAVRLALTNERAKDEPRESLHDIVAELRRTPTLKFNPDVVIEGVLRFAERRG
jgi:hypothetical protein